MEDNNKKSDLTSQLENVFTIDGRGRPKKCQLLLSLMTEHGLKEILSEISKMAARKNF